MALASALRSVVLVVTVMAHTSFDFGRTLLTLKGHKVKQFQCFQGPQFSLHHFEKLFDSLIRMCYIFLRKAPCLHRILTFHVGD